MTWTEKPPSGTLLDTGHSLYTGLAVCIPMYEGSGLSLYDPLRDVTYTLPSANWDVSGGLVFDADTDLFTVTYDTSLLDDFTIYIGGFDLVGTNDNSTFISGSSNGFRLYHSYTRINLASINVDNRFESITWSNVSDNAPHGIYVVGKFSTQTATIYFDGSTNSNTMTTTGTPATPADTAFTIGGRSGATNYHLDGIVDHIYIWSRQLSSPEIDSIQANPWQIFLDSGTPTEETVTDGVKFSESAPPRITLNRTIIDGFNFSDTVIGQEVHYEISTDGIKLSDEATKSHIFSDTLTDGIKLSDEATKSHILSNTLIDGIKLSDEATKSHIFSNTLTDGIKLSDEATKSHILSNTLTDGISFSDFVSDDDVSSLSVIDGVKFSDSSNGASFHLETSIDGVKFSDSSFGPQIHLETSIDGVKFSDSSNGASLLLKTSIDGVKFSDGTYDTSLSKKTVKMCIEGKAPCISFEHKNISNINIIKE